MLKLKINRSQIPKDEYNYKSCKTNGMMIQMILKMVQNVLIIPTDLIFRVQFDLLY